MEDFKGQIRTFIEEQWTNSVLPAIMEFITIPNLSPDFDKEWETNGLEEQACNQLVDWIKKQNLENMSLEVLKEPGRTRCIYMEIKGNGVDKTILQYAHYDKQPPLDLSQWNEGLHPYKPVIKDGKLYGRGGADDGYGPYCAILPYILLQKLKMPYARGCFIFEFAEESGSKDLPFYLDQLGQKIGEPELIVCLDSGAGDYEHLWVTNSLRGCCNMAVTVSTMTEGIHSGDAGGMAPETFRIVRELLHRLEDPVTGKVIDKFQKPISEEVKEKSYKAAEVMGKEMIAFPFVEGARPMLSKENLGELALNRWHRAQLSITGLAGMPHASEAGNVLRPTTQFKLSMRCPPALDALWAYEEIKTLFSTNTPHNAKLTFGPPHCPNGFLAPPLDKVIQDSLEAASVEFFGNSAQYYGMGGSIGFMNLLANKYTKSQFLVTGILGPFHNAHSVNEMLHIEFCKKIMMSMIKVIAEYK